MHHMTYKKIENVFCRKPRERSPKFSDQHDTSPNWFSNINISIIWNKNLIELVIFDFIITIIATISATDMKSYQYPINLILIK